jgi:hypothetical protein
LTVVVAFSAWVAISNHCLLGAALPGKAKPAADSGECPFHAKHSTTPGKQKPQPENSPCCKILRAISVTPTKIVPRTIVDLASVEVAFTELLVIPSPKISFRSPTLDTGPPGSTATEQLIGSMRAHAPPVLA